MKTIDSVRDCKIDNSISIMIRGGGRSIPTGINEDNMYTDAWTDSNNDGKFGVGDTVCFMEPYCCVE